MDISDDTACVTFKTCEGRGIQVNKYFLYLYDAFYMSIIKEHLEKNLVFIFDEATLEELVILKEQIYQKHLQCGNHDELNQVSTNNQKKESNEDTIDPIVKSIEDTNDPIVKSDDNGKLQDKDDLNPSVDQSSAESLTIECPFKCEKVPENNWSADTLFAHIYIKHITDVKNNFLVSIDTFIDRLGSKLSSTKCALKCEKSKKVYPDLRALRTHYHRCHAEEDPVICSNCGDSFRNYKSYYEHTRNCHAEEKKCDLCNNGKVYKRIYHHRLQFHIKEKTINCEVQGCKIMFKTNIERKLHTRVVHNKEKPCVCDKCGIEMARFTNLKVHRIKVHKEGNLTSKEYKEMIRSGQHNFVPKGSEIDNLM